MFSFSATYMKIWPPSEMIGEIHKSSETMSTVLHMVKIHNTPVKIVV